MIGIADFGKPEHIQKAVINPAKCNRMWGLDYLFMDSNNFLGGAGGSEYEKLIAIFDNIWKINGSGLFT